MCCYGTSCGGDAVGFAVDIGVCVNIVGVLHINVTLRMGLIGTFGE